MDYFKEQEENYIEDAQSFLEDHKQHLFDTMTSILSKLKKMGVVPTDNEEDDYGFIESEVERILSEYSEYKTKSGNRGLESFKDVVYDLDMMGMSEDKDNLLYEDFLWMVEKAFPAMLEASKEVSDRQLFNEVKNYLKETLTHTKKGSTMSLLSELAKVKAGLSIIAQEADVPVATDEDKLLPYEQMKRKPKGIEMGEYSLKPAEDLRRMRPLAQKLSSATDKIKELDEEISQMRSQFNEKIQSFKEEKGYEQAKTELTEISEKASNAIQEEFNDVAEAYEESKKILLEYKNTVYTIYDKISGGAVTDKEKLDLYMQAMEKLLNPDLVQSVNNMVNTGISQLETAKKKVEKRFVSFPAQKDIRKKVKEELPKKTETLKRADVWQSVKNFFSGLWDWFKGLFSPVKENAADLLSKLEDEVSPILNSIKDAGPIAMAGKK